MPSDDQVLLGLQRVLDASEVLEESVARKVLELLVGKVILAILVEAQQLFDHLFFLALLSLDALCSCHFFLV